MSKILWQSWSHAQKRFSKLPLWDDCPVKQVAPENNIPLKFRLKPPITGWCSWHSLGKNISHEIILDQAEKAKSINLEYILIDDGWCQWGDWQKPLKKKFPFGIKSTSNYIRKLDLKTGLWLAPFLVEPKSELYQNHPDWIIRDQKGKPVNGWRYSPFDSFLGVKKYILNFEIPEVRKYIQDSLKKIIVEWNISLIKLDFLYAPYFNPKYETDKTPHRFLVDLFSYLRSNFPQIYVIACGCPYKPAKYLVDAIRISPDINSPPFQKIPILNKFIYKNRFKHFIRNWENNRTLNTFFHLDPDAILYNQDHPYYLESQIKFFGLKL